MLTPVKKLNYRKDIVASITVRNILPILKYSHSKNIQANCHLYQIRLNSYRLVNFLGVRSGRGDFLRNAAQMGIVRTGVRRREDYKYECSYDDWRFFLCPIPPDWI